MKYNLRNLLYHLKTEYILKNRPDEYIKSDNECKENIYEAIKENIEFFTKHPKLYKNQNMYFVLSVSNLRRGMTLDEVIEFQNVFNKSATGLYGFEFDNSASLAINDSWGRMFHFQVYKKGNSYELYLWDTTGTRQLVSISTKNNTLTKEEIDKIDNAFNIYMHKLEEERLDKERYKTIKQYKEFIKIKCTGVGYAHHTYEVTIDKKIPIELTEDEIAKYTDNWNYCFGGRTSKIDEDDEKTVYYVKVYTD